MKKDDQIINKMEEKDMNMYDLNQVDKLISQDKTNKTDTKNLEDELLGHGSQKYGHVTDKDMQEQTGIRYGNITSNDKEKKTE